MTANQSGGGTSKFDESFPCMSAEEIIRVPAALINTRLQKTHGAHLKPSPIEWIRIGI